LEYGCASVKEGFPSLDLKQPKSCFLRPRRIRRPASGQRRFEKPSDEREARYCDGSMFTKTVGQTTLGGRYYHFEAESNLRKGETRI
jgi:hypothetical protein